MSSHEEYLRFVNNEHSNNNALNAYITSNNDKYISASSTECSDDSDDQQHMQQQQSLIRGRLLAKKRSNDKYYYSALTSVHIWCIVFVTSLNHLLRKFYEYFVFFIALQLPVSFSLIVWSVAALDFASIFSSFVLLPFVMSKSPHFIEFVCEIFIGISVLIMVWCNTLVSLFLVRFIFGIGYILLLSNWSACIATFVSPSKQSSAIGKIDLSWAFASFFFILCAYVFDNYGINYIFYILSILSILCSFLLFAIMPSQKLINYETVLPAQILSMFYVYVQHLPTVVFLLIIGLITFVNSTLTLILAPWLYYDYSLSITQFGYCTVIIGTAQIVAIIFSYQFSHKLGVGWSLLSGILVQCLVFIAIYVMSVSFAGLIPLLFILLLLSIHFIAAEFTYINAVSCMLHITPMHIRQSKNIAANAMRFCTSISRIISAILTPYLWHNKMFNITAVVLLSLAFVMHLVLMLGITNKDSYEYSMVSSSSPNCKYMFESGNTNDDEMNDEYIAKILSTNIDFPIT